MNTMSTVSTHPENLNPGDLVTVLCGESVTTPLAGPGMPMPQMVACGPAQIIGNDYSPVAMLTRDRSLEGMVLKVLGVNAPFLAVAIAGKSVAGPTRVLDLRQVLITHLVSTPFIDAVLATQEEQIKLVMAQQAAQQAAHAAQETLRTRQVIRDLAAQAAQRQGTTRQQGGSDGQS